MDVSRIKIKDQLFTLKDPVSRDLANAANAKAEQAINEPPVKDITYDEATSTISVYLTNKEAQV